MFVARENKNLDPDSEGVERLVLEKLLILILSPRRQDAKNLKNIANL